MQRVVETVARLGLSSQQGEENYQTVAGEGGRLRRSGAGHRAAVALRGSTRRESVVADGGGGPIVGPQPTPAWTMGM